MNTSDLLQQMRKIAAGCLGAGLDLAEFEKLTRKAFLIEALHLEGGNRSRTAKLVGEHRNTLARHMQELDLRRVFPDSRGSRPLPKPA